MTEQKPELPISYEGFFDFGRIGPHKKWFAESKTFQSIHTQSVNRILGLSNYEQLEDAVNFFRNTSFHYFVSLYLHRFSSGQYQIYDPDSAKKAWGRNFRDEPTDKFPWEYTDKIISTPDCLVYDPRDRHIVLVGEYELEPTDYKLTRKKNEIFKKTKIHRWFQDARIFFVIPEDRVLSGSLHCLKLPQSFNELVRYLDFLQGVHINNDITSDSINDSASINDVIDWHFTDGFSHHL
ncbi:hypothetical protein HYT02_04795 [Candidatus Gottesmanbacteria bacterium]|nr:hypothetical protein [Candidatus Gottesmanbacteria bacterium]